MTADIEWLRIFSAAAAFELSESDLEGVLLHIRPLKRGLDKMKQVDLSGIEIPLRFVPPGRAPETTPWED